MNFCLIFFFTNGQVTNKHGNHNRWVTDKAKQITGIYIYNIKHFSIGLGVQNEQSIYCICIQKIIYCICIQKIYVTDNFTDNTSLFRLNEPFQAPAL